MYKEGTCEFCGKETEELANTMFVSNYCTECHRILIEQSQEAIRTIRANKSLKRKQKDRSA